MKKAEEEEWDYFETLTVNPVFDCEEYTVDENSWFSVRIIKSEIFYSAMFDFADVPGQNSVLENSIHILWLLYIGNIYSRDAWKDCLIGKENRKH